MVCITKHFRHFCISSFIWGAKEGSIFESENHVLHGIHAMLFCPIAGRFKSFADDFSLWGSYSNIDFGSTWHFAELFASFFFDDMSHRKKPW